MLRTEKIIIFNGPKLEFDLYVNDYFEKEKNNYTLTKLVNLCDAERNTLLVKVEGQISNKKNPLPIDLLTISMNEFSGVTEAVVNNFVNFISKYDIKKIIIQNPPKELINDLRRQFDESDIHIHNHKYKNIDLGIIKRFNNEAKNIILGQGDALTKVSQSLFIQHKLNDNRPIVIMLYGPSGVGKTETGRFLANLLGEKMFYKQFSMFQNVSHLDYLFGDKVQNNSFSKDLLNRNSNIIFLDEFDKANNYIYSALYDMFDTGVFEDNNFEVNLENTLIICTSNFDNPKQILEKLGSPMFFRINCLIKYNELSSKVKIELINKYYNQIIKKLSLKEKEKIESMNVKNKYINNLNVLCNARQIQNFIRNDVAYYLINDTNNE